MPSRVFCELSQTMSWAKRKLKRLLCVLKTFFVAVSLDPAWDLAPSSMQGRLEEEWEWGKRRKKRTMRKMRRRSPSCRSSQVAPQLPFDLQPTLNKRPSLPCTDYLWQVIFHRCSNFHDSIRSHLPPDEQRARVLDPSVWPHDNFFREKIFPNLTYQQLCFLSPPQGVFLKNFQAADFKAQLHPRRD